MPAKFAKTVGFGSRWAVLLAGVLLLGAVACRRGPVAPEPPRLRAELVRELFASLEKRDYALALPKVTRLHELQPGSEYLAELEQAIQHNCVKRQLQAELDADRPQAARAGVVEAIRRFGRQEEMLALQTELDRLVELDELVDTCVAPTDCVSLARASARLKTLAADNAKLAPFLPLADARLTLARSLLSWERRRAVQDLCSDLDQMLLESNRDAVALLAVLAVADPFHPTLRAYRDFLDRKTAQPPLTYPPPAKKGAPW